MKLLAGSAILAIAVLAGAGNSRGDELLAPIRGSIVNLSINEKQSTYYRLHTDSTLEVTAAGPGWLSAIVRLILPPGATDSASYRVVVTAGADTMKQFSDTVGTADAELVGSKELPTTSRKFSFPISEKLRTYTFRLLNNGGRDAAVRFLVRRPSAHAKEQPLYPIAMDRSLTLLYHERRLEFHLATAQKPVKVRVIGPVRLRIVTRLVFGPTMKGLQPYALDMTLDKEKLKVEELSSTKAVSSEFEDEKEWLPGKSRTVYVAIPSGEHDLTIAPKATGAPGVAVRFTLPSETGTSDESN